MPSSHTICNGQSFPIHLEKRKFPHSVIMNVFARWRPLVDAETQSGTIDRATSNTSSLLSISINRAASPSDRPWKSPAAFSTIFNPEDDNATVYNQVVEPSIRNVLQGESSSFFAYGHSGSGKTHTIIGYEQTPAGLGLSLAAAHQLFEQIASLNNGDAPPLGIGLSLFELRGKSAFDLLNDRIECHIRQGPDGKTHIRGKTESLDGGKVRVRPILQRACWTYDSFREELQKGLARRAVGTSSIHDQSSRTHAVLELEIINQELMEAREALIDRQSELVPVGKRATDISIEEQSRGYIRTADGSWAPNPDYTIDQGRINAANAEQAKFEARVEEAEKNVARIHATPRLGGRIIFVDLAGAEYQQDNSVVAKGVTQTPQEKQEGRQINTDLLALKEVIRAWSTKQARVPFRSSPLTMVLREQFMKAKQGSSGMIVTCSPARDQYAATLNSLKYGGLVGAASK